MELQHAGRYTGVVLLRLCADAVRQRSSGDEIRRKAADTRRQDVRCRSDTADADTNDRRRLSRLGRRAYAARHRAGFSVLYGGGRLQRRFDFDSTAVRLLIKGH